ncbi:meiosis-specific with OB domain-containing protein [Diabrotica undecimpunctata]|uniref:meiosis-specific with OB domain-containing protein n=1 Tax=Diabrotica undecimpunctata TaxID=50387 RepID=UPI003B63533B
MELDLPVVALRKTRLIDLNPNLTNILIVGVIIKKDKPRRFKDSSSCVEGMFRAVWNFTLRDSLKDYINVTYWGSSEAIYQVNNVFRTGDVVEVINPSIKIRSFGTNGERFRPMVTSPYSLTLSEQSTLLRHAGLLKPFLELLHLPTKPLASFVPIRDIHNRGASINEANILVVVKGLNEIRTNISKNTNETYTVRTVEVFDHTSPNLRIDIWDSDIIHRSEHWKPRLTVLFMADIRIKWSDFDKQFLASVSGRTIVTENPKGKEVDLLLNYAKDAPIETFAIVNQIITALPDPNSIRDVMNVRQVHDTLRTFNGGVRQFTAVLYAFVYALDLDGLSKTLLIKCGRCKLEMKSSSCENSECSAIMEATPVEPEIQFDIRITLTDHTGSLKNCRFGGSVAEKALGCTAREFSNMSDDEKRILKWKYLLERCAIHIAVVYIGRGFPVITVLNLRLANPLEVSQKLAIY